VNPPTGQARTPQPLREGSVPPHTHALKPLSDKCFRDSGPRLAPTASFAWFYNLLLVYLYLIVLLYLFIQLLRRRHGGIALFKSMAEQFCWRQNLGPPFRNDPKMTKMGGVGSSYGTNKPPLLNPSFPYGCGTFLQKLLPLPENRGLLLIPEETYDLSLSAVTLSIWWGWLLLLSLLEKPCSNCVWNSLVFSYLASMSGIVCVVCPFADD